MAALADNSLGAFLRDRRTRLDPAAFGLNGGRRRTPGLRREEVAQRANISPTWYTWLEQGRGGAPSEDVLNRIAAGLMLTEPEREHLFMLGLGHPPEPRYQASQSVSARLQRMLDALPHAPALIKTPTWDVVAWNFASTVLMTDYGTLPPEQRNILRVIFSDTRIQSAQDDWMSVARYAVAAFRADATRAGAGAEFGALVDDLMRTSPDFAALWRDNDVAGYGEAVKRIRHAELGWIDLDFSVFAVMGRPDLQMMVYTPATPDSADKIANFIDARRPLALSK